MDHLSRHLKKDLAANRQRPDIDALAIQAEAWVLDLSPQPQSLPAAPQTFKNGEEWLEVSTLLPVVNATQEQRPKQRIFMPLTPQQLREHETLLGSG